MNEPMKCECQTYARTGQLPITEHHENCPRYNLKNESMAIIAGLIKGIEAWASGKSMNEPTKTNKFEPCPFCNDTDAMPWNEYYKEWIHCISCGARGPLSVKGDPEEAFNDAALAWNTRTLPAEVVEVLREARELLSQEAGWLRAVFPSSSSESAWGWCKAAENTITRIDAILKEGKNES